MAAETQTLNFGPEWCVWTPNMEFSWNFEIHQIVV
uniref:Uncharacterized protein n=1 Tax=Equus asinus TaxID=9793 RepID=A0A9L0IS94_EQUAS